MDNNMKKTIIITLSIISLISCRPQQILTERIQTDTTIVREVVKVVEVQGAVLQSPSINIDSLARLIRAEVPVHTINQTLIREDPETKLRVGILIDELGNLTALCEQQDRLIDVQTQEITRLQHIIETNTITVRRSWWDKIKDISIYLLIGFVVGATILSLKSFIKI